MRKREYSLHLRFTEGELKNLKKQAERAGLKPQAYIHMLLKNIQPKELPPHEYFEMLREIGRIGRNLNQIAMVANTKGFIDTDSYWENVRLLQESVGKIREGMW